jgi:hypothetical protein
MIILPFEEGQLEEAINQNFHLFSLIEQERIFEFTKEIIEAREELSGRFLLDNSEGLRSGMIQFLGMLYLYERKLLLKETKHLFLVYHFNLIINNLNI